MHNITLPPELRESLRLRRGKDHVYETIDPPRTALLVVDMQNHFVAPGAPAEVPAARGVVANINRLAKAVRASGGSVIWIETSFEGDKRWDHYLDNFVSPDKRLLNQKSLTPGNHGHAFWPELEVLDADSVVTKTRFSAFIQGASDIEERLRAADVDTVLVVGTLTNVCCESTVRDAMMLGFRAIMVEDGNAARSDQDHLAGLRTVVQVFGDVRTTDDVIGLLGAASESAASAAE